MTNFCRNAVLLVASFAATLPSLEASKVSSSVKVHLPKKLGGSYDHREALFGIPPYGGTIQQNVQYTGTDFDLCTPFITPPHWKSPFILMVDRGGCTFVQKVRNGQHAGAVAVIIADNVCQCKHEDLCTPDPNTQCEKHEPIMADDGSGYDITIPSVLMFKQDADPIKSALIKKTNVMLELSWTLPNPDDHVEWDLWTSPADYASSQFKNEFREAALALASHASFTPHMYVYDGIEAKCRTAKGDNLCTTMCTNGGRYCSTDPDGDFDSELTGVDVVHESARRLCIWENFGDDGVGLEWWDYVRGFSKECDDDENFNNDQCVKKVMEDVGIDFDRIEECIFQHGALESDEENDLMQKQLDDKKEQGIVIMPVAYVNGVVVRGALEFATIFKAICAGFAAGTAPYICNECANCENEKQCVTNGKCSTKASNTVSNNTFMGSLGGVTIFFAVIGAALYYRQQMQMRDQVRGILKEYMPVEKSGLTSVEVNTAIEQDEDDFENRMT